MTRSASMLLMRARDWNGPGAPAKPTLRDVQHALAREHGFAGWPQLKEAIEQISPESNRTDVIRFADACEESRPLVSWTDDLDPGVPASRR
jgi:hypothetical protein